MIDSIFEFILNLLTTIYSLFIADITCCYERIPLTGENNLTDALTYIAKKACLHRRNKFTKQVQITNHLGTY